MRECLVVVVVLVSLVHPVHTKDMADESPPNIRSDSRFLRDALQIGLRRSPTFATLVGELAQSNLIIHVETSLELPRGMGGMLRFVTAVGSVRYVRVSIAPHLTSHALVAMIGHELQHAVEIARAPEVTDQAGIARLYGRIGFPCAKPLRFDTLAAIRVLTQVLGELRHAPSLSVAIPRPHVSEDVDGKGTRLRAGDFTRGVP
jgi:hypothetical protein